MRADGGDSDRQLVAAIAVGDSQALQKLYALHGLHVLNYLIGQLGDRQLAEEVLQNVMLAVWTNAINFRGDSQVRTWLFAIARRQMLKARRSIRPPDQLLDEAMHINGADALQSLEYVFECEALAAALDTLPEDQKVALELVFYRGLTIAEAASRLNIPKNTLKSRLHRAKANLRRQLVSEDEDHG